MTVSRVVFDSWAWWEVLGGSTRGARLRRRYLQTENVAVHTSVLAVAEVAAKLLARGDPERAERLIPIVEASSVVHDVTLRGALAGARLRQELRQGASDASLADGIMAALAKDLDAVLISGDSDFDGGPRVKAA